MASFVAALPAAVQSTSTSTPRVGAASAQFCSQRPTLGSAQSTIFGGHIQSDVVFQPAVVFEVAAKKGSGAGRPTGAPGGSMPPMPSQAAAGDLPVIYIFARFSEAALPVWMPLGNFVGDNSTRILLQATRAGIGKNLYLGTVKKRITAAIAKNKDDLFKNSGKKAASMKNKEGDLEWGFAVRMKGYPDTGIQSLGQITEAPKGVLNQFMDRLGLGKKKE